MFSDSTVTLAQHRYLLAHTHPGLVVNGDTVGPEDVFADEYRPAVEVAVHAGPLDHGLLTPVGPEHQPVGGAGSRRESATGTRDSSPPAELPILPPVRHVQARWGETTPGQYTYPTPSTGAAAAPYAVGSPEDIQSESGRRSHESQFSQ